MIASAQVQGPRYGGILVMDIDYNAKSLNLAPQYDDAAQRLNYMGIFDRLVTVTPVEFGAKIYPDLAYSWNISPDGKTYTFLLFKNVTWHDGVKFASADVKWTLDKLIAEKAASGHQYLTDVKSVVAPDDYTVVITLNNPDATFLLNLGYYWMAGILPKHLYEGTDWNTNPYNLKPVGTGPYKFVEYVAADHATFEAYDKYHLGRPYVDRVVINFIPNLATHILRQERGESVFSYGFLPYTQIAAWKSNPNLRTYVIEDTILNWLGFNLKRKPYDDVRVRQAIAYGINRTDITQRVSVGLARAPDTVFMSKMLFTDPAIKQPEYNPARAEQLLDQAGLPRGSDGTRFKTTLLYAPAINAEDIAPVIKDNLKKIGVDVVLSMVDYPTSIDITCTRHDFDVALAAGHHGPDPNAWTDFVITGAYRNAMQYSNLRVDELFKLGKATLDPALRQKYYSEIQQILVTDMPQISLMEHRRATAVDAKWHGFFFEPDGQYASKAPFPFQTLHQFRLVWWEGGKLPTVGTSSTSVAQPPGGGIPVSSYVAMALVAIVIIAAGAFALRRRKSTKAP
jgi:peptide/nickel transport system substrate-binding protein